MLEFSNKIENCVNLSNSQKPDASAANIALDIKFTTRAFSPSGSSALPPRPSEIAPAQSR